MMDDMIVFIDHVSFYPSSLLSACQGEARQKEERKEDRKWI